MAMLVPFVGIENGQACLIPGGPPKSPAVNGQYEVPMGGQQKCPLVATKTARSWPTDLPTRGSVASAMKQLSWVSSWR